MPDNPTCKTCRWFVSDNDARPFRGECFKHPPTPILRMGVVVDGCRPPVTVYDFCGVHEPRRDDEQAG